MNFETERLNLDPGVYGIQCHRAAGTGCRYDLSSALWHSLWKVKEAAKNSALQKLSVKLVPEVVLVFYRRLDGSVSALLVDASSCSTVVAIAAESGKMKNGFYRRLSAYTPISSRRAASSTRSTGSKKSLGPSLPLGLPSFTSSSMGVLLFHTN
ncbi:unnamed protein product [Cyprideis torosa]|uniref:Uncharacterized protein n=1 Tax=Cyprideis torosa TaxID=163714 RepID=A0A7R8W3F4_9CRUS|nr:unnamed protein product [Cyprideis torosa]CAG0882066.1 unnamed protein product [Cyprideis torosa]